MSLINPSSSVGTTRPSRRLWFPLGAGGFALLALVVIQLQPELERNIKTWLVVVLALLFLGSVLLWFLFLSRLPWKIRGATVMILALGVFGLSRLVRVDGSLNGTGLPRLVWKWSHEDLARFARQPDTAAKSAPTAAVNAADIPDVPQFLGPNRDGLVPGVSLARDWNATPPKQLWRQPIGKGWSAFAVVGGRAYTQEQRGDGELVTCYEALTGRLLWAHTNIARFNQWQGGEGPRATPTLVQGQVFAYGASGVLDCLDAASGRRVWSRGVLTENHLGNLTWGVSCSPLVFDDTVVVTGAQGSGPTVLAYRRQTGQPLWHAGKDKASYASPVLATLAGRRLVLSANAGALTVHDPATGQVLLQHAWGNDQRPKASQPVVLEGDRVFLSAGYNMGCVMLQVKAAPDGKLTAQEVWKGRTMKNQFNTSAVRQGCLYGLDDGLLACVDAATGERKWKEGHYGSGQSLLVDDLVLIQSEPGEVVLAEAKSDAFHELARLPALSRKTWNYPTLAGRYLLVRNDQEAACYELPLQGAKGKTIR